VSKTRPHRDVRGRQRLGSELTGKPKGPCTVQGLRVRGRLVWGDVRKPSLMSRDSNRPGRVVVLGGQGRCRCDAAGGGRGHIDDRVDTVIPGIQRAPNPSRVLRVWNVETPSGSGGLRCEPMHAGKPTVREAQFPGGNRMPKKRTPVAERRQETSMAWPLLQAGGAGQLAGYQARCLAAKAG
jgi:hypothetical protein